MQHSILSKRDRLPLENGMDLRLLSAQEVMLLRRQAETLAESDEQYERALCSNACLIARALEEGGEAVFEDGGQVLRTLRIEEIEALARRWAEFNRAENPGLDVSQADADKLKKTE